LPRLGLAEVGGGTIQWRKELKMFDWLRRRRLSPEARRKLLLVAARADEALIETHVSNLLDLIETLNDEVGLDRAVELYAQVMSLDETRAATVANRLLSRLDGGGRGTRAVRRRRRRNAFREPEE